MKLALIMAMTKTTLFSLIFFCSVLNADIVNFKILNKGQSAEILSLNANAQAVKLIRNKAYRSFEIDSFDPSACWLDYINNKKIIIHTSHNSHKLIKQNLEYFYYELDFNPKKILIKNVTKKQFIKFCKK